MDHVLARLSGVKIEEIKKALKANASKHAEQGLTLRHVWRNADDGNEILFIFTTTNLENARQFIEWEHARSRKESSDVSLPEFLFLKAE